MLQKTLKFLVFGALLIGGVVSGPLSKTVLSGVSFAETEQMQQEILASGWIATGVWASRFSAAE